MWPKTRRSQSSRAVSLAGVASAKVTWSAVKVRNRCGCATVDLVHRQLARSRRPAGHGGCSPRPGRLRAWSAARSRRPAAGRRAPRGCTPSARPRSTAIRRHASRQRWRAHHCPSEVPAGRPAPSHSCSAVRTEPAGLATRSGRRWPPGIAEARAGEWPGGIPRRRPTYSSGLWPRLAIAFSHTAHRPWARTGRSCPGVRQTRHKAALRRCRTRSGTVSQKAPKSAPGSVFCHSWSQRQHRPRLVLATWSHAGRLALGEPEYRVAGAGREAGRADVQAQPPERFPVDQAAELIFAGSAGSSVLLLSGCRRGSSGSLLRVVVPAGAG